MPTDCIKCFLLSLTDSRIRNNPIMKTIYDARNHCRFLGEGIEKSVADGEDLFAWFEGTPVLRFKVEREGA